MNIYLFIVFVDSSSITKYTKVHIIQYSIIQYTIIGILMRLSQNQACKRENILYFAFFFITNLINLM